MSTGRPTLYSQELAERICSRIADGESTRSICADRDCPCMTTLFRWLRENESFKQQYARAKEVQLERMAEEILEISDDGTNDTCTVTDKNGEEREVVNHDHINRSRLRVDTRKWLLSKLMPKKYGDKVAMEHSGPDGAPIEAKAALTFFAGLPREASYVEPDSKTDSETTPE